jgi:hypothetical protein
MWRAASWQVPRGCVQLDDFSGLNGTTDEGLEGKAGAE